MDISLGQALHGFHLANEAKGLAAKTVWGYDNTLRLVREWLAARLGRDAMLSDLTREAVRAYINELCSRTQTFTNHKYRPAVDKPLTPGTISGYFRGLSSFCNWAVKEEMIAVSPTHNVPRPKVPRYLPDPLSEQEIKKLVDACKVHPEKKGLKMIAMILALLDTGVRMNELLTMTMANLQLEQGRIKVMGKGAKVNFQL